MPPFPSLVDTVLFDFDGTLVDASVAICGAFRAALDDPHIADERITSMIGHPLRDMLLAVRSDLTDHDLDRLVERYREAFLPLSLTQAFPLPGAKEAVLALRKTMRLAVVTTRMSDGAIRMLQAYDMLDAFEFVVGLEHVSRAKPDPEPVIHALQRLGASAERAVMVGDTPQDVFAGLAAGTGTVGVTSGSFDEAALKAAGAHIVIGSLVELVTILQPKDDRITFSR